MSHKILICDDEEGIRESLKLILSDFFELVVISEADKCLETLKGTPGVGLVLLDIKMPRISGLELLQRIKKEFPKVNVIIVTGYKSVETAQEAVRLGASGYIVKPFASEEILATARKNLGVKVS